MSITHAAERPGCRPWRRYLRFSVRALIVVVVVIGCCVGWLARGVRIQREAVAAIRKNSGDVWYDWEWRNGRFIRGGKPWAPRWLVDFMGIDYFGHVVWVSLPNTTSSTMERVGRLDRLRQLSILKSPNIDADLAHLRGLTELTELNLGCSDSTLPNLVRLKGMAKLTKLALASFRVTDSGMAQLESLGGLTALDLGLTGLTDAGLEHLKGMTKLSRLADQESSNH